MKLSLRLNKIQSTSQGFYAHLVLDCILTSMGLGSTADPLTASFKK